jgi:hypothetical protein
MKFLETSAKTSQNVEEAFITMTKEIILEREKNQKKAAEKPANIVDLSKKPVTDLNESK